MRPCRAAALLLPLLLAGPPGLAQPGTLEGALDGLVARSGLEAGDVSVAVVDPRDGRLLFAHRADAPTLPASCIKVATTAAALTAFGPDAVLRTRLVAAPAGGGDASVVPGDLWLLGGGDPGFSEHGPEGGTATALDAFAAQVAAKGVRAVRGDLVLDASYFRGARVHPSWTDAGPAARWYAAEVDALTVNDGCVDVSVEPGRKIRLFPETGLVTVEDRTQATALKAEHGFGFRLSSEGNVLEVSGKVWTKSSGATQPAAIHDPALLCAEQVGRALARAGIRVEGVVRRPREGEKAPSGAALLAEHRTPLSLACAVANTRSQNLWAETIFRVLGAEKGGEGSFAGGARAVKSVLGIPGLEPVDGSGLSRDNRATAESLARVLAAMWNGKSRETFFSGLAKPGTGTLDDRFGAKRFEGRLRAKTGTLTRVSGLAGLATHVDGSPRCFAVLAEHADVGKARRLQDAIVGALVGGER